MALFLQFYSKMLATRLISNVSVSKDAEESMITKLKVCPNLLNLYISVFFEFRTEKRGEFRI